MIYKNDIIIKCLKEKNGPLIAIPMTMKITLIYLITNTIFYITNFKAEFSMKFEIYCIKIKLYGLNETINLFRSEDWSQRLIKTGHLNNRKSTCTAMQMKFLFRNWSEMQHTNNVSCNGSLLIYPCNLMSGPFG